MSSNANGDALEVDVEGLPAGAASEEEEEIIEIDDTMAQIRKDIRELREKLLQLRRQAKSASKQEKRALQEEIAICERKEDEKRHFLEQEQNKAVLSKMVTEQKGVEEAVASLRSKKLIKKMSQAQKKAAHEQEAREFAASMPNKGHIERISFERILGGDGLRVHDIEPDGNCLFEAIAHQMVIRHERHFDQLALRKLAADHIYERADKYAGFIDEDLSLEAYCQKLRDSNLWGGQLEIDALVQALGVPIKVYQADAPPMVFENTLTESEGIQPLTICFQKFAYSLGEHYDSLIDNK